MFLIDEALSFFLLLYLEQLVIAMLKISLISFSILFCFQQVLGQVNRFVVFLKEKDTSAYHLHIDSAKYFLSQRAIDRRKKWNIPITAQDFPVDESYVSQLEALGIDVFYRSKWMNLVSIEAEDSKLPLITCIPFVEKVDLIGPGSRKNSNRQDSARSDVDLPSLGREGTSSDNQNRLMRIGEMHADGFTGNGVLIAVMDAGFLNVDKIEGFEHLFRNNQILATHSYVEYKDDVYASESHGTSVLSCIAGKAPNFIAPAPDADFMLLVTEDVYGEFRIEEYNWLFAAEFADSSGADMISTSLGYGPGFTDPEMSYNFSDIDGNTTVVARAAKWASDRGILVVTSAGNSGNDKWKKITSPADVKEVLAVGSIDQNRRLSFFSSRGPTADGRLKPDVVSVGQNTVLLNRVGNVNTSSGTSFSAPLIAGLVASIWQRAGFNMRPQNLIDSLRNTSSHANNPDTLIGYGWPDYLSFFEEEPPVISISEKSGVFDLYPTIVDQEVHVNLIDVGSFTEELIQVINFNGIKFNLKIIDRDEKKLIIDVSNLDYGIYLMRIGYRTKKFIKK